MTRLELPPDLVEKLRAAARDSTDPVEFTDADGIVLIRGVPSPAADVFETQEEIREMLDRLDPDGPTYTHEQVMKRLREDRPPGRAAA